MVTKIIHQIVFGKIRDDVVQRCLDSWQILKLRGFEIRVWDLDLVFEFISNTFIFALPAFETARNLGEASDICRYLIVHHFGGYCMDWDVELQDLTLFMQLDRDFQNGLLLVDPKKEVSVANFFLPRKMTNF